MDAAMISSLDDFSLLLNKWITESKELFMIMNYAESPSAKPRWLMMVVGKIYDFDEKEKMLAIKDDRGNAALVRYSDCRFAYESELNAWGVAHLTGRTFEDVFVLDTPNGVTIAIGTANPPNASG